MATGRRTQETDAKKAGCVNRSIIRGTYPQSESGGVRIGALFVVTGPSGVGKGTVTGELLKRVDGIAKSVSITTRPIRQGEKEGADYFFRSDEDFASMRSNNQFLEFAEFAGNFYGTPENWVEAQIASGTDVILEIEVQGARQVAEKCPEAVLVFLAPPSYEALVSRLKNRATESDDKIAIRLEKARKELKCRSLFDYEVINDNVEEAVRNLEHIVYAERLRIRKERG